MTGPHRGLSRFLLGLLGLVLVAVGAAIAAAGLFPSFAAEWTSRGTAGWDWTRARFAAAPAGTLGVSWWTLAALAALVVAVALLVLWILSRIGRRPRSIDSRESAAGTGTPAGTTTVDSGLAAQAVRQSLDGGPGVSAAAVSAWKTQGAPGLRITVRARKGASPRTIADTVEESIRGLDEFLGNQVPVVIRIRSGARRSSSSIERVR